MFLAVIAVAAWSANVVFTVTGKFPLPESACPKFWVSMLNVTGTFYVVGNFT
jgi:hypothetical protein